MSHIVFSTALDELSNVPGGNFGLSTPSDPTQTQPRLFTLYQTTKYGPQNGWRLVLASKGASPKTVEAAILATGPVDFETAEMLIFDERGTMNVEHDTSDNHQTNQNVTRAVVRSSAVPVTAISSIANHIRRTACFPLALKETSPLSQDSMTGKGGILATSEEPAILVVFEDGVFPETVEEGVQKLREENGGSAEQCIVFEDTRRQDARVVKFS